MSFATRTLLTVAKLDPLEALLRHTLTLDRKWNLEGRCS